MNADFAFDLADRWHTSLHVSAAHSSISLCSFVIIDTVDSVLQDHN